MNLLHVLLLVCSMSVADRFYTITEGGRSVVNLLSNSVMPFSAFAENAIMEDGSEEDLQDMLKDGLNDILFEEKNVDVLQDSDRINIYTLTDAEKLLLSNLSDRYKKLKNLEKLLVEKNNMLRVTEKLIEDKTQQLEELKDRVDDVLEQYTNMENDKIQKLVKVYENMKPKDASAIFDSLHSDVLLEIARNMKQENLAPILANMDEGRAREVTVSMANYMSLSKVY